MVRKSTLEEKNKAMADLFLTLEPEAFEQSVRELIKLRKASKKGFEQVLEQFDEQKQRVPPRKSMIDVFKMKFIKDARLNSQLCLLLLRFWHDQDLYQGGYHKRRLPVQIEESDDDFMRKYHLMYGQMMSDMLDVLKSLNYYQL